MSNADLTPAEYAAEYGAARQRIRSVIEAATADPTTAQGIADVRIPACPDWSLTSICSHLAGICHDLVERNVNGGAITTIRLGQRSRHSQLIKWQDSAGVG